MVLVTLVMQLPDLSPRSLPFTIEQIAFDFVEMDNVVLKVRKLGKLPAMATSSGVRDFLTLTLTCGITAGWQVGLLTTLIFPSDSWEEKFIAVSAVCFP